MPHANSGASLLAMAVFHWVDKGLFFLEIEDEQKISD